MASTNETKGTLSYTDAQRIMYEFNTQMRDLAHGDLALDIRASWDWFGDRRIRIECQPAAIGDRSMDDTIERCASIIREIEKARDMAWFEGYEVAEMTDEELHRADS